MALHAPIALVILDGFGYRKEREYNAIAQANTPHFDQWFARYPHTLLKASGTAVGLPEGYMGNSEVGHMTIGAGRVIPQMVTRINEAIDDGSFFKNETLIENLKKIKAGSNRLHIIGLLSDAGVHCHTKHIFAYIKAAYDYGIKHIFIHPFLDGRDTPPKSARVYLQELDTFLKELGTGTIGSLHGRFYAMDRDHNWERTQTSYRILTETAQPDYKDWQTCLDDYYEQDITDEFIPPSLLAQDAIIQSGDGILCANFRPDRARQITAAFIMPDFIPFRTSCTPETFITPVSYADDLKTQTLFKNNSIIQNTFCDTLHTHKKRFYAIAETEKYAHVTYFFKGGREEPYDTETQVLVPSLVARNYVQHPEMSAAQITDHILDSLHNDPHDVYLINYANADMVGHSGNLPATIKAIETLDREVARLYDHLVTNLHGTIYLTSDHGNAEQMYDPTTHQAKTAHTTKPVPFMVMGENTPKSLDMDQLADIAPFILGQMNLY